MDNPYTVLGVSPTATEDEIRRAYRRLAKEHHPDLNPGDKKAEERFKAVSAANDLLSDPEKRARFDRGEIDAAGNERPPPGWREAAGGGGGKYYRQGGFQGGELDLDDILGEIFGRSGGGGSGSGRPGGGRPAGPRRGEDVTYTLKTDFRKATEGGETTVTLPDGRSLKVTLPPGLRDRQTIRLKGQGLPGRDGGPPGDAYVEVLVDADPVFERDGDDIRMTLPVALHEAVLGAKVEVPTLVGPVNLTIPKGSNTGATLRLRGKGVPKPGGKGRGDQYIRLVVMLPPKPDAELSEFLKGWAERHAYDPRRPAGGR